MRDDLLDAQATVEWAKAQIPVMQQRFLAWQRDGAYEMIAETDPDTGEQLIVAKDALAFDLTFNAEAGAIINGIRSALDIVAASLARRNRVKPTSKMHFPIYTIAADFLSLIESRETKKVVVRLRTSQDQKNQTVQGRGRCIVAPPSTRQRAKA